MNVTDKTGRKLKVGQVVDIMLIGMFRGQVVEIQDNTIVSPAVQIPPHATVQVITTPLMAPDGSIPDVYIVQEPDPNAIKKLFGSDGKKAD